MQVKNYVVEDKRGTLRVGHSRVSLDSVVIAYEEGLTAEAIQEQYPSLSLEEVYGGIAFYLANCEEVQAYLKQQGERWEQLRRKADENPSPAVARLRALRAAREASQ